MPPSTAEVSVSTVAATATSTGHHMLKIKGFKHLRAMHQNGSYFESCRFEAAGHTWKLHCYPSGNRRVTADNISLFLMRDDAAAADASSGDEIAVHAKVRFELVHRLGRWLPWPPKYGMSLTAAFPKSGDPTTSCWGFSPFADVEGMELMGFLKDECLTVRCDITVVEKSAVKDEVVKAADMERLGMLCKCKDDLCKRHHRRPAETGKKLRKAFGSFFRSIGG